MVESIRIGGKLSREDFNEVKKMLQSKFYWPKSLLQNWYGLMLVVTLLWATAVPLWHRDATHWVGLTMVWTVAVGVVGWAVIKVRRELEEEYRNIDETLSDFVTIEATGLYFQGPGSAYGFSPWVHYKRWREGRNVVILYRSIGEGFVMLSTRSLSASEREQIRKVLMKMCRSVE